MQCPKCQFENPVDSNFCLECGQKLDQNCPECGKTLPAPAKFCNGCGHKLVAKSESSPKDLSFDDKLTKIQKYLPKGLTDKILSQRDRIEGERKQVTVLFCDMVGYTALSESIGPDEVYEIMDKIYDILIHKVHDYEGTVNEMTGDGIMALFGAPIAMEDAPQRAIHSALAIQQGVAKFNDNLKDKNKSISQLKMRIGIHTGPVVVGTLGNDLRVEFKAVGDTVNTASRMEGLAEPGTVYLSEDTFKLAEGLFQFEALGEKEVKGKETPIKIYRVISPNRRTRFDVNTERGLTPFIGRERELELLIDGFERTKEGRGQALSIIGEAGLGKSRLMYEFRKAIANENVNFLEGKCLSFSSNVAYHPVIDVLKSNFQINDTDNDADILDKVKSDLKVLDVDEASALPYLLELLSVRQVEMDKKSSSPETMKDRIFETLNRILVKGSQRRPVILTIEDLHWLDKSSEETFKSLLDTISGERIFVIFTYRPEYVHTWGGKSYHSQINLNRLSNRQTLSMVTNLLRTEGIDRPLENLILEKTDGVPFFIEEFIKSLISLKLIVRKENTTRLVSDAQILTIPVTIQDVIMARIDRLPEGAKKVAQTGSVIEREFSYDLIKVVMNIPEPELLSHLSALKDLELLYERGIYPNSTYVFKHALTQEVAYHSLLNKSRKEVHDKIAMAMEGLYTERVEEFYEKLAYHYSESDNYEKACKFLKLSGEKAVIKFSNFEAFGFYEKLFFMLDQLPDSKSNKKERINAGLSIFTPMRLMAFPENSLNILEEGARLSKDIDDMKSLTAYYSSIGKLYTFKGNALKAGKNLEELFQASLKLHDIDLIAPVASDLISFYAVTGTQYKIVEISPKIIDLLEKTKSDLEFFGKTTCVYSDLLGIYGVSLGMIGNFKDGELWLKKGLKHAQQIEHVYTEGWLESHHGTFFVMKGEAIRAIKHAKNAYECFKKTKANPYLGWQLGSIGFGYYLQGDLDKALEYLQRGYEIQNDLRIPTMMSQHYWLFGCIYFSADDLKKSQKHFEKAIKISQKNHEKWVEGLAWIWLGRTLGKADSTQKDTAEECIRKGIEILANLKAKPFFSQGYLFLGELYIEFNYTKKALESLKIAEENFKNMEMDYWLDKTQEVLGKM